LANGTGMVRHARIDVNDPSAIMPAMASPMRWPIRVLGALAFAIVVIVAFLAGMLAERMRFDAQREDMLRRYDNALR
jgi:hypothetical protein